MTMKVTAAAARTTKPTQDRVLPQFAQFRAKVQTTAPDGAWLQLRKVARSIFGKAAFEDGRVSLGRAQLRYLSEHRGVIRRHFEKLQDTGALPKDTKRWSAKEAAGVFAHAARSVLPGEKGVTFKVATVNDDFTDRKTNLRRIRADVMLVQEGKNTDYRKALDDSYGVHQHRTSEAKAGSAVVWKKGQAVSRRRGYALGVEPNGAKMLTRWISYNDMVIDGRKVRMISVHRPPKRFARLWPAFDRHLAAFVKRTRGPVIIGMDANQRDPKALARRTGLRWVAPKGSIDGFLVSSEVKVEGLRRLPKGSSDHHPVVAKFRLKR